MKRRHRILLVGITVIEGLLILAMIIGGTMAVVRGLNSPDQVVKTK